MSNPANPAFSISLHNPDGGNIQQFIMLLPTDPNGNPINQPFAQRGDSMGNVIETDPIGNPMSQDKNAGCPQSVGSYTYTGGHLVIYMAAISGHSLLLGTGCSFFFDGYFVPGPGIVFTGNLKGLLQRGSAFFGPASQGTNYFLANGACTIAVSPMWKPA